MKKLILPAKTIPDLGTYHESDQFSVDETVKEVVLLVTYVKGAEAGIRWYVSFATEADNEWYSVSGINGPGFNPLLTFEATMTADFKGTYQIPIQVPGFYKIFYCATDAVGATGTFEAYKLERKG